MIFDSLEKLKALDPELANDEDDALWLLLRAAVEYVEGILKRPLEQQAWTEFYSGDGSQWLSLRKAPVLQAGLQLWLDAGGYWGQPTGAFPASSALVLGTDFYLKLDGDVVGQSKSGMLHRPAGWTGGNGNIKVTYTAGWTADTLPNDLELAILRLPLAARQTIGKSGPLKSERLGKYSYQLASGELFKSAMDMGAANVLKRYRKAGLVTVGK